MNIQTSRRDFLKGASAAGAVLVVGFGSTGALAAGDAATQINPFVKVGADGTVTVVLKHFEMGQGTTTGLSTLVAEEMDADWETVAIEFAPANDELYKNLLFGSQGTGGSTAIANSFMQYRQAGAAARAMLLEAAAEDWGVDVTGLSVENGVISDGTNSGHFGDFVGKAASKTAPEEPALKDPSAFRLIGKAHLPRKDTPAKINGTAKFAVDVHLPDMAVAVIMRAPKFGGTVASFDKSRASETPGFIDAIELPTKAGIVVYGENTWAAIRSRDRLVADWEFGTAETRSTDQMVADAKALVAGEPQYRATEATDPEATAAAIDGAANTVEAEFVFPYLAHAPMEPLNCTIEPTGDGVRVHDGCQFPAITKPTVAAILGIDAAKVEIETVYAGGSFGRRAIPTSDYHAEAAMAFKLLGGDRPVKLMWTREDDLAGGYFRPLSAHKARIGLDADGKIVGWDHNVAGKSIFKGTVMEDFVVHDGVDHSSVEGIADTPYAIPGFSVGLSDIETPITVLWWRSVGHSFSGYVMESLMDMAADAAGRDPVEFRLSMLSGDTPDHKRMTGVLKLAAEKAGWDTPVPDGRGRGVAVHKSFNTYVAEVTEVSVDEGGAVRIEKITCAVDCGVAVNPDVIKAQMEGGIGYGIGHIMRDQITFTEGVVDQFNFPDYEPLRMPDIGAIEVHIVESAEAPTGVGEPGLPPAGPALANAIARATGKRVTTLPMAENGIEFA